MGPKPTANADRTIPLSLFLESPSLLTENGQTLIPIQAHASVNSLTFIPNPSILIEKVRSIGDAVTSDIRRDLESYYTFKKASDAADYDKDILQVMYTNFTETPSEAGAQSPIGSKPLVNYPKNEVRKVDGSLAKNSKGETLGLCGMPYTGHKSSHCQALANVTSLLCPEGKKTIVDPVTLKITQTCLGVQGEVRKEWETAIEDYKRSFQRGLDLMAKLEALDDKIADRILNVRFVQISGEASTYGRSYKIFRGIQRYQRDTKTAFTSDMSLDRLLSNPGQAGWRGPYITLDANESKEQGDATADAWGTKFRVLIEDSKILVKSAGPNQTFAINTMEDDLVFSNGQRSQ